MAPGEIAMLLYYLLSIAGPGYWDQIRDVIHIHAPASEAAMISIADHLRQEGRQEGHLSALRGVLRGLLADRFGALPPEVDARIDATESVVLEQCIRRAVTAAQLDDVFAAH